MNLGCSIRVYDFTNKGSRFTRKPFIVNEKLILGD